MIPDIALFVSLIVALTVLLSWITSAPAIPGRTRSAPLPPSLGDRTNNEARCTVSQKPSFGAGNGSSSDTQVPTAQVPLLIVEPLVHSARISDSRAPLTLDAPVVAAGTDALAARGAPRVLSMPENAAECPEPSKDTHEDRAKCIAKEPQQPSKCPPQMIPQKPVIGAFLIDDEVENLDGNNRQRHQHSTYGCK
eukprot:m51a1_g13346 hypothetical protein (194) ;mRNA; r:636-1738